MVNVAFLKFCLYIIDTTRKCNISLVYYYCDCIFTKRTIENNLSSSFVLSIHAMHKFVRGPKTSGPKTVVFRFKVKEALLKFISNEFEIRKTNLSFERSSFIVEIIR